MRKLYKSILALSLLTVSSEARNFKIFVEENGVDINFPFEISDNFIAEFGYYSNKDDLIEDFSNRDGKIANNIDENNIFASIKYNITQIGDTKLFVGLEYEKFKRDNEQMGYYTSGTRQVPYNNDVKLNGEKFNILSEAVYGDDSDKFRAFLRATITPKTSLDYEQNTKIFPNATTGGEYTGSTEFDLSYMLEAEMKWNATDSFDIGIGGSYAFMPYEYNYKGLNDNKDGYVEKSQAYDEKTIEYSLKIRLKKLFEDNVIPTIGYKWIKVNSKKDDTNRDFFFAGIEKWF